MTFNSDKFQFRQKYDHSTLALIMCIPCLLITTLSLVIANVSGYLIAFIIIVLSLLGSFVVVISKQRSEQQIRTLANILESMIEGDYTLRGRLQSNQALQELLSLVNSLADTLSQHKIAAKESKLLLEKIMQQMDAMVFAINELGTIVMANDSAQKLILGKGKEIGKVQLSHLALGKLICQANTGIINFSDTNLHGEHFLFKETFLSDGKQHQLFLITSAERLLLEKERKAWQSLLRVLSHELNNSLTPIASISQSMKSKLENTDKALNRESLCEGVNIINERAKSLSLFIASYSQLSHLPHPNKCTFDLKELIAKIAQLFSECQLEFVSDNTVFSPLLIHADKAQIEQVLINIFKNALEAMATISPKVIEVSYQVDQASLQLFICDQGRGISNEDNLFVPFYTTKPEGSGIGLTLCRQILFNHSGFIKLTNRANVNGAQALISLPYHPSASN